LATIRTVGAPAPNRAGHVLPQHEHVEIAVEPFSGSVVPRCRSSRTGTRSGRSRRHLREWCGGRDSATFGTLTVLITEVQQFPWR
jgi:hypothetical protein